jgi:hypothetical protein
MKRREFISVIGGATAWPLAARAQHLEAARIKHVDAGILLSSPLVFTF